MNLTNLKDYFLKYWKYGKYILLAIVVFFVILQCNRTKGLEDEEKNHKAQAEIYLNKSRDLQHRLDLQESRYQTKVDSIVKIEKKYAFQLAQNSKNTNAKLSSVSHFSTTDNTNYFKDRYNDNKNVIQVQNGTTLKDTISKRVISDLIIGDGAKADVKILREVFKTKDEKFGLCNDTVDSLKLGIKAVSDNYEKANAEKDNALKDSDKAVRRERNKKNLYKGITIALILKECYTLFIKH